jgi:hypothetical protein
MAILPDHHHPVIGSQRDDINPVSRFDNVEVMFDTGSRREGGVRPYGEDTEELVGLRSNARPWFDHLFSPYSIPACRQAGNFILFGSIPFVKSD